MLQRLIFYPLFEKKHGFQTHIRRDAQLPHCINDPARIAVYSRLAPVSG